MITSADNPHIKHIKKLLSSKKYRVEAQQFIAQNPKVIQSIAEHHPKAILKVYIDETSENPFVDIQADVLPAPLFKSLSSLKTPQGLLAVIQMPTYTADLAQIQNAFILDQVQSPANIGAIIRNAVAFGIDAIFTTPNTADPYHPESVQASAGTVLNIPIHTLTPDILNQVSNYHILGLRKNNSRPLEQLNKTDKKLFVFGSEGSGIQTPWLNDKMTQYIAIPISDSVESLNVAATSAIIGYFTRNSIC